MKLVANLDVNGNKLENGELEYGLPSSSGTFALTSDLPTDYAKESSVSTGSGASKKTAISELRNNSYGLEKIKEDTQEIQKFVKGADFESNLGVQACSFGLGYMDGSDFYIDFTHVTDLDSLEVGSIVKVTDIPEVDGRTYYVITDVDASSLILDYNNKLYGVTDYIEMKVNQSYRVTGIYEESSSNEYAIYVFEEVTFATDGLALQGSNPKATLSEAQAQATAVNTKLGTFDNNQTSGTGSVVAWFNRLWDQLTGSGTAYAKQGSGSKTQTDVFEAVSNAGGTSTALSEASSANSNIGTKSDNADDTTAGSVFARLRAIINKIGTPANNHTVAGDAGSAATNAADIKVAIGDKSNSAGEGSNDTMFSWVKKIRDYVYYMVQTKPYAKEESANTNRETIITALAPKATSTEVAAAKEEILGADTDVIRTGNLCPAMLSVTVEQQQVLCPTFENPTDHHIYIELSDLLVYPEVPVVGKIYIATDLYPTLRICTNADDISIDSSGMVTGGEFIEAKGEVPYMCVGTQEVEIDDDGTTITATMYVWRKVYNQSLLYEEANKNVDTTVTRTIAGAKYIESVGMPAANNKLEAIQTGQTYQLTGSEVTTNNYVVGDVIFCKKRQSPVAYLFKTLSSSPNVDAQGVVTGVVEAIQVKEGSFYKVTNVVSAGAVSLYTFDELPASVVGAGDGVVSRLQGAGNHTLEEIVTMMTGRGGEIPQEVEDQLDLTIKALGLAAPSEYDFATAQEIAEYMASIWPELTTLPVAPVSISFDANGNPIVTPSNN